MSLSMRIAAVAAGLAALVLSVTTASACCGGCGCGGGYGAVTYYQPVTVYRPVTVYAPVQPTYPVDQGPAYTVPAPVVTGVPDYVGPVRRWGYRGWGYRGGYRGWGYRGGIHRVGYRGVGGWGRRWGRY